jgi:hypothetical protein
MQEISFDNYNDAYNYLYDNLFKIDKGYTIGIDASDMRTVRISPPKEEKTVVLPDTWKKTHFTSDGMDPIVNQVDGKVYDSRSSYYKSLKDTGNHVLEAGESYKPIDVTSEKSYQEEIKKDVAETIQSLNQRRK